MGVKILTTRNIIGEFFRRLEVSAGENWISDISMMFESDQASETYGWLGQVPAMREWIGKRQAKGLFDNSYIIKNKKFEASLEIDKPDFERDKTGQVMIRVGELAERSETNWNSLVSALLLAGVSATCYDGQYFFDTDHVEGKNTTNQSNSINADISTYPTQVQGTTTAPSAEEMSYAIMAGINKIRGFKDNENEPMNELAKDFVVLSGSGLAASISSALASKTWGNGGVNVLASSTLKIDDVLNSRLDTWTTKFAVIRKSTTTSAFILQNEKPVELKVKDENSEYCFDNDKLQYGIDARRNAGYGLWQHACLVTLT